jgi:hypothetical protein
MYDECMYQVMHPVLTLGIFALVHFLRGCSSNWTEAMLFVTSQPINTAELQGVSR